MSGINEQNSGSSARYPALQVVTQQLLEDLQADLTHKSFTVGPNIEKPLGV